MRERERERENRELMEIFGPKRHDVTGLEETAKRGVSWFLLSKYCSGDQIEKNERRGM